MNPNKREKSYFDGGESASSSEKESSATDADIYSDETIPKVIITHVKKDKTTRMEKFNEIYPKVINKKFRFHRSLRDIQEMNETECRAAAGDKPTSLDKCTQMDVFPQQVQEGEPSSAIETKKRRGDTETAPEDVITVDTGTQYDTAMDETVRTTEAYTQYEEDIALFVMQEEYGQFQDEAAAVPIMIPSFSRMHFDEEPDPNEEKKLQRCKFDEIWPERRYYSKPLYERCLDTIDEMTARERPSTSGLSSPPRPMRPREPSDDSDDSTYTR